MIPTDSPLGRLRLVMVLDEYDGPKIFIARSTSGALFIAFWVFEDPETWLYAPISEDRIAAVKSGVIPIRDVFIAAEDGWVFRIELDRVGNTTGFRTLTSDDIDLDELPPEDDRLEPEEVEDLANAYSLPGVRPRRMRIYIHATGDTRLGANSFIAIRRRWNDCQETAAHSLGHENFRPGEEIVAAATGSIRMEFKVTRNEAHVQVVDVWAAFFHSARNSADILAEVRKYGIDTEACLGFLNAVRSHNVAVRISTLESNGEVLSEFEIAPDLASVIYSKIYQSPPLLSSSRIPQADDLEKVVKIARVRRKSAARIEPNDVGVGSARQVNYYRHAARILGVIDVDDMLTVAGQKLSIATESHWKRILGAQFELSDCGAAWMRWAGEATLANVEPESAEDFLLECMHSIAKETAHRRSKTISGWHAELFPKMGDLFDNLR